MFRRTGVSLTSPRIEGKVEVPDGRRIAFSEFGQPRGRAVVWLHGTPGGRRQIPDVARIAAMELDLRIIGVDRPGVGGSTPHMYDAITDFAGDLEALMDCLGIDKYAVLGLSGGGPYVLACAAAMPDRVKVAGVLGGVAPTVGPDAADGGIVQLSARFAPVLTQMRIPIALGFTTLVWTLRPLADPALRLYARLSPPGDRAIFARPEMRAMFLDDLVRGSRVGLRAPVYDALLFGRHWGFDLSDVTVPVHWWHGDADHIIPLAHGEHCVRLLPDAKLHIRPGESHLGTLGAAEEILGRLMRTWDEREGLRRPTSGREPGRPA